MASGPLTIVNNAQVAFWAAAGTVQLSGQTITLTGSYNYAGDFARAVFGTVDATGTVITGSGQTGRRFSASSSSRILTNGGGPTFWPGDVVGFTSTTSDVN